MRRRERVRHVDTVQIARCTHAILNLQYTPPEYGEKKTEVPNQNRYD